MRSEDLTTLTATTVTEQESAGEQNTNAVEDDNDGSVSLANLNATDLPFCNRLRGAGPLTLDASAGISLAVSDGDDVITHGPTGTLDDVSFADFGTDGKAASNGRVFELTLEAGAFGLTDASNQADLRCRGICLCRSTP